MDANESGGAQPGAAPANNSKPNVENSGADGNPCSLPKPWPEPVDGGALLAELVAAIQRHVVLSDEAALAVALWVLATWLEPAFDFAPRLAITSPEMRCGKTTLLDIMGHLARRPLPASNVTSAVVFRTVEAWRPTLLIDEADTFLSRNDDLRGILNSGHRRATASVLRAVKTTNDDWKPSSFSTWGFVAIAAIGAIPSTLEDRAIVVRLQRKSVGQSVARLDRHARRGLDELARKALRWADDYRETARDHYERIEVPASLHGRAADNWEPLLTVAELAGSDWPARARAAAADLSAVRSTEEQPGQMLLRDLRSIFADRGDPEFVASKELIRELTSLEERPWSDHLRGKPLTARALADLLRPYGVEPSPDRKGQQRGYYRNRLTPVWEKYCPPVERSVPPAPDQTVKNVKPSNPSNFNTILDMPVAPVDTSIRQEPSNVEAFTAHLATIELQPTRPIQADGVPVPCRRRGDATHDPQGWVVLRANGTGLIGHRNWNEPRRWPTLQ